MLGCLLLFFWILVPVASATAAGHVSLRLQNGDRLSGELLAEDDTGLLLRHPLLGELRVPKDSIVVQEDSALPAASGSSATAASKSEPQPPATVGLFGSGFLAGWDRQVAFGLKGEEGNDVSQDWTVAIDLGMEDEQRRIQVSGAYFFEYDERKKDTSKGHLRILHDWLRPDSDWFYFFAGRFDYDSFKSWKERLAASGGSGYRFLRGDEASLNGRVGLGSTKSWGDDGRFEPEAVLGLDGHWQLSELSRISARSLVFPSLSDRREYRTQSELKWDIRLGADSKLSLELAVQHEYESKIRDPLEDEKHFDLLYSTRLGIDF